MKKISVFLMSLIVAVAIAGNASATAVDLELSLLVDVSGSVDSNEFTLQRDAYAAAFNNTNIWDAISNGALGKIAVNFVYWSSENQQQTAVDWTLISSQAEANAFANAIATTVRPFSGWTGIGDALVYGADSFSDDYDGTRKVIDVSGDGVNNEYTSSLAGRNYALANGVDTINGIVIGGSTTVYNHYATQVIGGPGAFVMEANSFADFAGAVDDKLIREITGEVPEPGTMLLMGTGLASLLGFRRRKNRK